ncbi:MAG: hypothetical protein KF809_09070 [Chloroflexi bacterium]|nr:hypothetical protein [Chloroflexota bacterium]
MDINDSGQAVLERPWRHLPILKAKDAELGALEVSQLAVVDRLTPMFDLFDDGRRLARSLGRQRRAFGVAEGIVLVDGNPQPGTPGLDPVTYREALEDVVAAGWIAVPVTGLRRSDAYREVVTGWAGEKGTGAVVRLLREDFQEPSIGQRVDDLLNTLELLPQQVDLVIDLRSLPYEQVEATWNAVRGMLLALPVIDAWRHLAVAATGMPADMRGVEFDAITPLPRSEWALRLDILDRAGRFPRLPTYSDYVIAHPDDEPSIGGAGQPPNFRFTHGPEWLIVRGAKADQPVDRFRELLATLPADGGCDASSSCAGERWVREQDFDGPSNATTRRRYATIHHLSATTQLLSSQPAA